jgi:hypothetical protein
LRQLARRSRDAGQARRLVDVAQWVWEDFRLSVWVQTLSRELRALGCRKLSARPRHHAQGEPGPWPRWGHASPATESLEAFKSLPLT